MRRNGLCADHAVSLQQQVAMSPSPPCRPRGADFWRSSTSTREACFPSPTLDAGSALREDRLGALRLLRGQAGPGQGARGARPVEGHSSRLRGRKARRTQERGDPRRQGVVTAWGKGPGVGARLTCHQEHPRGQSTLIRVPLPTSATTGGRGGPQSLPEPRASRPFVQMVVFCPRWSRTHRSNQVAWPCQDGGG